MHKLVLIVLDGFRWDYVQRDAEHLPGFSSFFHNGVQTESLVPVYPVESCPNWATISTGVYTNKHGILGNVMFNPLEPNPLKARFQVQDQQSTSNPDWWEQGPEPIWITAAKHGKTTYTRFWSRSDLPFKGIKVEDSSGYPPQGESDLGLTFQEGLKRLQNGYDFLILYYEHTDNIGHRKGPESPEMYQVVRNVDKQLAKFLDDLKEAGIEDKVNLIIASDHGMSWTGEASGTKYLNLKDYVNEEDVHMCVGCGPSISILPVPGKLEQFYSKLKAVPGLRTFKREEIPEELRFKDDKCVLDLHVMADQGYFIRGLPSEAKQLPYYPQTDNFVEGVHGWLPDMKDQHGVLFCKGPDFRKNVILPPVHMVDLYQLFAHLLGVPAGPNDGNWSRVAALLVSPTPES